MNIMIKVFPIFGVVLLLSACVSSSKFKDQQAMTAAEGKRAETFKGELEASRSEIEAGRKISADLSGQLKTQAEELASLKKSGKDLQQALESNRGELSKKIAELIREKDAAMQKLTEASAESAALSRKLVAAEVEKKALEDAKALELSRVRENYEQLNAGLKAEIAAGQISISQLKGKLTVNMVDRILFDSGKAEVKDDGRKVLEKVGEVLKGVAGKDIRIEGHTDNKPIAGDLKNRFPSNWELSTARATAVGRFLQDQAKVAPERLIAAGFGEYHPVAPNDTPENRALNRRIEIILVPRE